MALDSPVHAPETADGTTAPAVALCVALGSTVQGDLARYPAPHALVEAGRGRIARTVRKRTPRLAKALTATVAETLDAQTVVVPVEAVTGRVIAGVVVELDRTLERRKRLEAEIEAVFKAHPFGRITRTLPRIGPRTGSRILGQIGDGSRFANGSRLASYAGLAPVTRQSGSSLRGEAPSRRGSHRLKNAMFLAASASLRDPASRAFYDRKRDPATRARGRLMASVRPDSRPRAPLTKKIGTPPAKRRPAGSEA